MESTSSHVIYRSLQSYWRRRAYQRLDGSPSRANKKTIRLGGGSESRRRKRSWKKMFRIKVRIPSPKKLLLQLRDAYVNSMLVLAGGVPSTNKSSKKVEAVWGKRIPKAREVTLRRAGDFETRMIVHIYNAVMSAPPRELISCA